MEGEAIDERAAAARRGGSRHRLGKRQRQLRANGAGSSSTSDSSLPLVLVRVGRIPIGPVTTAPRRLRAARTDAVRGGGSGSQPCASTACMGHPRPRASQRAPRRDRSVPSKGGAVAL
jgi:hypothetical protein